MNNTIYVVYASYYNTMEEMFVFTDYEQATAKQLELSLKWVNSDKFNAFLQANPTIAITVDTMTDYYMENEEDTYVGFIERILITKD